ncbi:MAG: trypsin-like peptidase domain-containing protein [Pirellulales bacterium]|nr:trypsin-like peptidase domain-containing protein [Pirellulales bacterium]
MVLLASRSRRLRVLFALIGCAFSSAAAERACAQASAASSAEIDRSRLFEELHRDVAAMQRELSIYKRVVQLVAPSVVHVQATPLAEFRFRREVEEAGSGVVVAYGQRNFVLTNRHVVKHSDVDNIRLELNDGRQFAPTQILMDKETDVAVLSVDEPGLIPARIGNSDLCEIGDIVMAFGNPFNLRQSVTRGIISGKGRSNLDLGDGGVDYQDFMQTDAAINPGNSGGPLINLRAEVIGLNTAIASNSGGNDGIGFSIPINIAVGIMRQLIETGRVERGFLGVTLDGYYDARAAQLAGLPRLTGARVKSVTDRSPAAQAGVRIDDIILRFNGAAIENDQHLISLVKLSSIGRQVDLQVLRDGRLMTLHTLIGRLEDFVNAVEQSTAQHR